MIKKILMGVMAFVVISQSFGQNWKNIKKVFKDKDKDECFFLDSTEADSLIKYIGLSGLDTCRIVDSSNCISCNCLFDDFSLAYLYKIKSHQAYMIFSKDKQEYQAWMRKKYALKLLNAIKQKCSKK